MNLPGIVGRTFAGVSHYLLEILWMHHFEAMVETIGFVCVGESEAKVPEWWCEMDFVRPQNLGEWCVFSPFGWLECGQAIGARAQQFWMTFPRAEAPHCLPLPSIWAVPWSRERERWSGWAWGSGEYLLQRLGRQDELVLQLEGADCQRLLAYGGVINIPSRGPK